MVDAFKKHNSKWESVRVIMADKDMTEREVFAAAFPNSELFICLYHTFCSFQREITVDKLGIKEICVWIFCKEWLTQRMKRISESCCPFF